MRRFLAWAFAALFCAPVLAVSWDRNTDFAWNVGNGNITAFPGQGSGQMWSSGTKTPTATGPQWNSPPKALPFNPSPTFNFKAKFSPLNMAKALANPLNLIPLAAAPILSQLFSQACIRLAGGTMQVAPGAQWEECIMSQQTVYEYKFVTVPNTNPAWGNDRWFSSRESACSAAASAIKATCDISFPSTGCPNSYTSAVVGITTPTNGTCQVKGQSGSIAFATDYTSRTQTLYSESGQYAPISTAAAETKIKTKLDAWSQADFLYGFDSATGKPSGGTGAVLDAIMNTGNRVTIEPASISATGPASLPGTPVVETTTNSDGSIVTKTTNITNNYTTGATTNDNRITITHNTTTTTTTTNNQNSNTTTTTTAKSEEPDKSQCEKYPKSAGCEVMGEPATPALPSQPELYERKYPDGLGALWTVKLAEMQATPLASLGSLISPPSLGDTGACPQWSLGVNIGLQNWGTFDTSIPCWVWTFMRWFVLIGSLFLARKLIFGG